MSTYIDKNSHVTSEVFDLLWRRTCLQSQLVL